MNELIGIPGEGNFKRDANGAIINTNKSAIKIAREAKQKRKKQSDKLDLILEKLENIEKLLGKINDR